jgi:hypothetical protein
MVRVGLRRGGGGRVGVAFGVVIGLVGGWRWEYGWGEGGVRERKRQYYP